jgi:hypothetical protein
VPLPDIPPTCFALQFKLELPAGLHANQIRRGFVRESQVPVCVQERPMCPAGDSPAGVRIGSPVAGRAGRRETDEPEAPRQLHPRDGGKSLGRNASERAVASKMTSPRACAPPSGRSASTRQVIPPPSEGTRRSFPKGTQRQIAATGRSNCFVWRGSESNRERKPCRPQVGQGGLSVAANSDTRPPLRERLRWARPFMHL